MPSSKDASHPETTDAKTRCDSHHERAIRAHVEALNEAVRSAQTDGLHINLGLSYYSGSPPHTEVNVAVIERPRKVDHAMTSEHPEQTSTTEARHA